MRRILARLSGHPADAGFSLAELIVSMAVSAVVMVLATAGVLLASGTSARVDAAAGSQQQAHQAFDKLDRVVRWASAVTTPGTVDGNPSVEWLYTAAGAATCHEIRLDGRTQQLQWRSWTQGDLTTVTAWTVVASDVSGTTPFTTTTDRTGGAPQTLRIAVVATAGGVKNRDNATHDVTYTAVNSRGVTTPTTACTEGRTLR